MLATGRIPLTKDHWYSQDSSNFKDIWPHYNTVVPYVQYWDHSGKHVRKKYGLMCFICVENMTSEIITKYIAHIVVLAAVIIDSMDNKWRPL